MTNPPSFHLWPLTTHHHPPIFCLTNLPHIKTLLASLGFKFLKA